MVGSAEQYLEKGEKVEAIFPMMTGPSPWAMLATILLVWRSHHYVVAVTNRSVLVLHAGSWSPTTIKGFHARYPRAVRLGPVHKIWTPYYLLAQKGWVHRRFWRELEAADERLGERGIEPLASALEPGANAVLTATPADATVHTDQETSRGAKKPANNRARSRRR